MSFIQANNDDDHGDDVNEPFSDSEPEDGEISTTSSSSSDDSNDDTIEDVSTLYAQDVTSRDIVVPVPCVRIVVVESPESLTNGKLFIVTCTGLQNTSLLKFKIRQ